MGGFSITMLSPTSEMLLTVFSPLKSLLASHYGSVSFVLLGSAERLLDLAFSTACWLVFSVTIIGNILLALKALTHYVFVKHQTFFSSVIQASHV